MQDKATKPKLTLKANTNNFGMPKRSTMSKNKEYNRNKREMGPERFELSTKGL